MNVLLENGSYHPTHYELAQNDNSDNFYNLDNCLVNKNVDHLKMTDEDSLKLMSLLETWDLSFLHQTCVGKKLIN